MVRHAHRNSEAGGAGWSSINANRNSDTALVLVLRANRGLRGDDGVLRPEQEDGLLHHPDLHPLHPHRRALLGLLLDQEGRDTRQDGAR